MVPRLAWLVLLLVESARSTEYLACLESLDSPPPTQWKRLISIETELSSLDFLLLKNQEDLKTRKIRFQEELLLYGCLWEPVTRFDAYKIISQKNWVAHVQFRRTVYLKEDVCHRQTHLPSTSSLVNLFTLPKTRLEDGFYRCGQIRDCPVQHTLEGPATAWRPVKHTLTCAKENTVTTYAFFSFFLVVVIFALYPLYKPTRFSYSRFV